jgi:hypothetical protein
VQSVQTDPAFLPFGGCGLVGAFTPRIIHRRVMVPGLLTPPGPRPAARGPARAGRGPRPRGCTGKSA